MIVWIFRFHNVEKDFEQFKLNKVTRSMVGAIKVSLATILVLGIWYQEFILTTTLGIAFFMLSAQYFHHIVNNDMRKRLPSLSLLILCIFIILTQF
jgi:hypothetical protein